MGLERTALPTSWGRIGPEWLNSSALGKTDPGVLAMNDPWTEHDREHVITGGTKGAVSCCGV